MACYCRFMGSEFGYWVAVVVANTLEFETLRKGIICAAAAQLRQALGVSSSIRLSCRCIGFDIRPWTCSFKFDWNQEF